MMRVAALAIALLLWLSSFCAEPNAIVRLSVASLRAEPSHASELETQALLGTPVLLTDTVDGGEWAMAELPDGYKAYMPLSAVVPMPNASAWRRSDRLIGTLPMQIPIYADTITGEVMSDFVMGCIVEGSVEPGSDYAFVTLPDGRQGWVLSSAVAPFAEYMSRGDDAFEDMTKVELLMGTPYLWGGRSTKAIDCSGLTQLIYFDCGLILPRNASQQALCGEAVALTEQSLSPGDLLFFKNDAGRVTHVAIYRDESTYIHASGMVHISSMDPTQYLYNGRTVHFARRLTGRNPKGVVEVINHPWYFE